MAKASTDDFESFQNNLQINKMKQGQSVQKLTVTESIEFEKMGELVNEKAAEEVFNEDIKVNDEQ